MDRIGASSEGEARRALFIGVAAAVLISGLKTTGASSTKRRRPKVKVVAD